jgi:hypothetical protein
MTTTHHNRNKKATPPGWRRRLLAMLLLLMAITPATAQIYPVQSTTQLVPPYAVYLPDYATGINNQLRVLLLNKDITQPGYKVKLVMSIELNGSLLLRTSDNFAPAPITLQPNTPYSVEGLELAPYLNSNNIDFIGYSRQDYEQKKGLPEGSYKICFTAYDYRRPDRVQVSNEGCSFYYLTKNDPPFVNMPACGIFITPLQDDKENLIDRAGRWLSYSLDLPWDNTEKNRWYNAVATRITQVFEDRIANTIAKSELLQIGKAYAAERNRDWEAAYGEQWGQLVLKELTKDEYIYWSRTVIKTGSTQYQLGANPDPATPEAGGEAAIETEITLQPYVIAGAAGNSNINFMWTPRHTASPNSTLTTRYRIELYEVRPKVDNGQLPAMANHAVQTSPPVFTDETDQTTYTYGPDKPQLIDGLQYAWRVKAFDAGGRDWFKNNGYSEVCYFSFGGVYNPQTNLPGMEEITGFMAQPETERRGWAHWQPAGGYSSYRVRYRRKNGSGTWFEVDSDSTGAKLYDLAPGNTYQAQVQGKAGQYYGPFSAIREFTTPMPMPPAGCGQPLSYATGLSSLPLPQATAGMSVQCGKFEVALDSVQQTGGAGYYSGSGRVTNIPFLTIVQVIGVLTGNSNTNLATGGGLQVTFSNIFINQNREVTQGTVYAVTRPLEEWLGDMDEYFADERERRQESENRRDFSWLDSNAALVPVSIVIRDLSYDKSTGTITLTDDNGNTTTITLSPEQRNHDVIVQGSDGNQYVIKKDGTVVAVPAPGGLYPGFNVPMKTEETDVLQLAMAQIRSWYHPQRMDSLRSQAAQQAQGLSGAIRNQKNVYTLYSPVTGNGSLFLGSTSRSFDSNNAGYVLGRAANDAARELNMAILARRLSRQTNTHDEFALIAGLLRVGNQPFKAFVQSAKATQTPAQMAEKSRIALLALIESIITQKIYDK